MTPMKSSLSLAALAAAFAIGGAWMLTRPDAPGTADLTLPGAAMAQDAGAEAAPEDAAPVTITEMAQGAETAPVTLIEYASYTCPHCAAFHADQYQQLKPYIADGRVRYVFREVYFDRFGLWASILARCSGDEMRFFGLTEALYAGQRDWIGDQQPGTIADNLMTLGLTAGLDQATLDACFSDQAKAEALVAWFETNRSTDGVDATPTLFINGEKYTNMPWGELQALIDPIVDASDWAPAE
jgi:protein-disulfide isomerase